MNFFQDAAFFAAQQISGEPWFITRVVAQLFGYVIDFLFNIVYAITPVNSLGLSIILLTVLFRTAMLPLTIKSQKSMMNMRKIQPELKKIDEKYGKSKDPEIMKKVQAEKTALMAKHDANPLKGCLPMLIQMPLFFGLIFIMQQAFLYISTLRHLYYDLSASIINVPGVFGARNADGSWVDGPGLLDRLVNYRDGGSLIPNNMQANAVEAFDLISRGYSMEEAAAVAGEFIALGYPPHLSRVLNRFTSYEWSQVFDYVSTFHPAHLPGIEELYMRLMQIETFMGLSVVERAGWGFPGILIPLFVGITMLLSAWLTQLRTHDPDAGDQQKMQQRMMLIVMPIVMAVFTVNFPVAVGIYWISSQIFGVVQDLVMNKRAGVKFRLPFVKEKE